MPHHTPHAIIKPWLADSLSAPRHTAHLALPRPHRAHGRNATPPTPRRAPTEFGWRWANGTDTPACAPGSGLISRPEAVSPPGAHLLVLSSPLACRLCRSPPLTTPPPPHSLALLAEPPLWLHECYYRAQASSSSPSPLLARFLASSISLSSAFSSPRAGSSNSSVSADSTMTGGGATGVNALPMFSWPLPR